MSHFIPPPSLRVSRDDIIDAHHLLEDRIAQLEALLASGNLSETDASEARVLLTTLRNSLSEINPGRMPVQDDLQRALDRVGAADLYIGDDGVAEAGGRTDDYMGPAATSGVGGARSSATADLQDIIHDGPALRDMFEQDPQAFMAGWRELEAEERQLALFTLQQEVALDNQITQMITGTMKSAHDTAMAVARNLQV